MVTEKTLSPYRGWFYIQFFTLCILMIRLHQFNSSCPITTAVISMLTQRSLSMYTRRCLCLFFRNLCPGSMKTTTVSNRRRLSTKVTACKAKDSFHLQIHKPLLCEPRGNKNFPPKSHSSEQDFITWSLGLWFTLMIQTRSKWGETGTQELHAKKVDCPCFCCCKKREFCISE